MYSAEPDPAAPPILRRARELAPLLATYAADTERAGDLDPRSLAALVDAGMFSLFAPGGLTGADRGLATSVAVFAALGRGCGASAWVSMILSVGGAIASLLGDEVRTQIWDSDPKAAIASVVSMNGTSRRVRGGWRVSGRWQPASGILHAKWVLLGVPVEADQALALIPVGDVRIVPTWSVSGLQGTGSETVEVDDVFVPEDRIVSMAKAAVGGYASERPDEPFAVVPIEALCATTVFAPLLGMAEAAVAQAVDTVRERGAAGTGDPRAAGSPAARMKVATAASLVDSAWLHADRAVGDVTAAMRARRIMNSAALARIAMDAGVISTSVRTAVGLALEVSGSRAFATGNPLQRIWRDVEIACTHQLLTPDTSRERYGRTLLDLDS